MLSLLFRFTSKLKNNKLIVCIIVLSFILRIIYALCIDFDEFDNLYFQDYTQIYLLGLKAYTTHSWPYWGPDITYTYSQMPGAMQGLLVALPFYIFESPYAPFIFLNFLSVSALVFFGWYISKRISGIPKWFVYAWLLTAPWTTNYSTTVVNPSYVLAPAILFFTAIIELLPFYEKKILSSDICFFFLGFSLGWIMQIYMSWMMLPFYILLAFVFILKEKKYNVFFKGVGFFLFGLAITLSLLIPTFLKYGFATGGSESAIHFNTANLQHLDVLTRFTAFSTYEAFHFMSGALVDEQTHLYNYWWGTPVILFLFVVGICQTLYYMSFFFRKTEHAEFKKIKLFVIGSIAFIYVSYLFTVRDMASYTFYMFLPVSFWFSFYCLEYLFRKVFWRKFAVVFILCGLVYHVALAKGFYKTNSLFVRLDKINLALKKKDSRLFAYRRVAKWEEKERMKNWVKTSNDSADVYTNNFDSYTKDILPEIVSTDYSFSPPYSCRIDTAHEYSIGFTKPLKETGATKAVRISFVSRSKDTPEALVCLHIKSGDKSLYWWSENIKSVSDKWTGNSFTAEIPKIKETDVNLEIFVSLTKTKSNPVFYIDNFKLEFK